MWGSFADSCIGQESFLPKLIKQCQPKMVKIIGAGAGRVDGYASGIIVGAEGTILTSQGVFLDGSQVRVELSDGQSYPATILRRNRTLQLALLKIEADRQLEHFKLSDRRIGEKGDWVLALSNAFKVANQSEPMSAMIGIISLRSTIEARLNERDVAYQGPLVLIDAITSNPGASGGAVVNTKGQLVGMIGKLINSSETNTRINYAVPNATLKQFVDDKIDQTDSAVATADGGVGGQS
jgi:serine protease Do